MYVLSPEGLSCPPCLWGPFQRTFGFRFVWRSCKWEARPPWVLVSVVWAPCSAFTAVDMLLTQVLTLLDELRGGVMKSC